MAPRSRIVSFGSAAALILLGGLCGLLVHGLTGEVLAGALISVGFGGVILLLFLEVGLSEDRELEREEERRRKRRRGSGRPRRRQSSIKPRRRP
jgi:hypothetical protein